MRVISSVFQSFMSLISSIFADFEERDRLIGQILSLEANENQLYIEGLDNFYTDADFQKLKTKLNAIKLNSLEKGAGVAEYITSVDICFVLANMLKSATPVRIWHRPRKTSGYQFDCGTIFKNRNALFIKGYLSADEYRYYYVLILFYIS